MAAAVAGRGRLRASHADREDVIDTLKAAFAQGRLAKDEFDARVGQTFASLTYAELAALTADLPAGPIGVRPLRKQARPPRTKMVTSGALAVIAAAVAALTVVAGAHAGPTAGTQACQAFFTWADPVAPSTLSLNVAVAIASQGSDGNLAGDLESLQQAVWQYENPGGGWQLGSTQQLDLNRVAAASTRVSADCIPYVN